MAVRPFFNKLIVKLFITLLSIVSIVSIVSILYFTYTESKSMKVYLNDSIANTIKITTLGLSAPLWHMDTLAIQNLTEAILLNEVVIAINVFDGQLFKTGLKKNYDQNQFETLNLQSPFTIPPGNSNIKKSSEPVIYNDRIIGRIELFYTEQYINDAIGKGAQKLTIAFGIIAFSIVIVIFYLLRQSFIKPILTLADISLEIAKKKEYSIRVKKKTDDEIGILYDGFNNMLENIHTREIQRDAFENELKRTRSFLNNIIESMPSMLISIDEDGIVTQWNQAAVETTGILATDIIGKIIWETTDIFDEYRLIYKDIIKTRAPLHLYRKQLQEKEERLINVSLFPLIENGVNGLVIRMDDVTELEKKDEQLRQSQKMETIGTLAGGLAHDFNNVLGGIVGTISVLKHKINHNNTIPIDDLKRFIETMQDSGQRAVDMVQQLLTLSRKKELSFAPVDLNLTINHVLKICKNTFDKKVEVRPIFSKTRAMVQADPTQIEQVLLNLAVNSLHAMTIMCPEGQPQGGQLYITLDQISADKHFCMSHPEAAEIDYWNLSVRDTGVGMDTKTLAKMFDPFFTTKEHEKGTGLGLAMVYNIIRQHKGFIDVYSEVGVGTTINVYLPALTIADTNDEIKRENLIPRGQGLILVIDDEPVMRELAQTILEECGYEFLSAENGEEGVEIFRQNREKIKLTLLDMVMPKKSGKETFIEMKKIDPDCKVILASGFKQDERVEDVLQLGVKRFIQKPYTLEKLAAVISEVLST